MPLTDWRYRIFPATSSRSGAWMSKAITSCRLAGTPTTTATTWATSPMGMRPSLLHVITRPANSRRPPDDPHRTSGFPFRLEGVFQPGFLEAWPKSTPIFPSDRKRLLVCVMTCSCPCLLVGIPVSGHSSRPGVDAPLIGGIHDVEVSARSRSGWPCCTGRC